MGRKVLEGLEIAVTRPEGQGNELAGTLRERGARVVLTPLIKTVAPASFDGIDRALRDLASYDTVVFTSANAVAWFFRRAGRRRLERPKRLFAIGGRTASALARAGWRGAKTPKAQQGEGLARLIGDVRGRRVLIPRAKVAREILPEMLRRRGALVRVVEAYRTVPDPIGIRRIRTLKSLDAVTFTSESTVEQFFRTRCRLGRAAAASIGPVTSAALRRRGVKAIVEAARPTARALGAALARFFRRRPSSRTSRA